MQILSDPRKIRLPGNAQRGGFYSDDPVELAKQIAGFFAGSRRLDISGTIVGLICPHAGYEYSGAVAAAAYKQLQGLSFDTVVIISPSHRVFFRGASVYSGGAYRTPLGDVPLDLDFCSRLTATDPAIALADIGHEASGGTWEHALEVHLPFLQIVLGGFALVPIVMGDQEYPTAKKLGENVARLARAGKTLIVASSDLAHGHDYQATRTLDAAASECVERFSPGDFYDRLAKGDFEACGGGPITAAMIAARILGADRAQVVSQRNSGDVTGVKDGYIVGYLSAVMYRSDDDNGHRGVRRASERRSEPLPSPRSSGHGAHALISDDTLDGFERDLLLATARRSIERTVKGSRLECPESSTDRLKAKRGVFVTLRKQGQLRGCIGYVRPYKPLIEAVWEMAESAALRDYRFIPVEPSEVDDLEIEITVLSPLQTIDNPDHVLVGRHGVLITRGHQQGVFLPQVAVENDWDRETFLSEACRKAELPPDAWRDPETTIEVFTAEVFG